MNQIGHNNPPRHEAFAMALEDVRLEAGNFLDGAPVETQDQADAIGVIMASARDIKRDADAARKEDKQPHLDAGRKVDADYKPVLQTADDIIKAAQAPLAVFLAKEQRAKELAAQKEREEAERMAAEALKAERAAVGDVEAIEAARAKQEEADKAQKTASRVAKAPVKVAGSGRSISLRTKQVAVVQDYRELLLYVAKNDKPALDAFLDEYARKALPSKLPGVEIVTERSVA
jgi:hypothetical protein